MYLPITDQRKLDASKDMKSEYVMNMWNGLGIILTTRLAMLNDFKPGFDKTLKHQSVLFSRNLSTKINISITIAEKLEIIVKYDGSTFTAELEYNNSGTAEYTTGADIDTQMSAGTHLDVLGKLHDISDNFNPRMD